MEVPYEELDLCKGRSRRRNSPSSIRFQRVPVLILDDGTAIAETMAICRYFEETKPEPALFGKGAKQRAAVEMWNRRMELGLLACVAQAFRHLHPAAAQLEVPQVAAWGEANKPRAQEIMQFLDERAGQAAFHRRGRVFGGRHHGAGGDRLCRAGQGRAAARSRQPGALASGSLGATEREGLRRGGAGRRLLPREQTNRANVSTPVRGSLRARRGAMKLTVVGLR